MNGRRRFYLRQVHNFVLEALQISAQVDSLALETLRRSFLFVSQGIVFTRLQAHDDVVADAIDDVNRSRQDLQVDCFMPFHLMSSL